eukprot:m.14484 g.14484  ORF g.14484 m.14484 type:complete len:955 (-) comp5108_c0_seq1:111-2975(-)
MSLSSRIVKLLHDRGVRTQFCVPGAYAIDLIDTLSTAKSNRLVLASHEAGAVFMAAGYSRTSGSPGCAITTAGPGAFNALNGLAAARAERDPILFVHGEIPKKRYGKGALQDARAFQCDIGSVVKEFCIQQFILETADGANSALKSINSILSRRESGSSEQVGPVHFMVGMDVFQQNVAQSGCSQIQDHKTAESDNVEMLKVVEAIEKAERPLVFVGHGVIESVGGRHRLTEFLDMTNIPAIVTGRGVASIPHDHPSFIGQHSIFPSPRAVKFLEEHSPDLLVVLGSSLGEYSTNSWSGLLSRIPNIIHVDTDSTVFGRLGSSHELELNIKKNLACFLTELTSELKGSAAPLKLRMENILKEFDVSTAARETNLYSRSEELLKDNDENTVLTGQRVVYDIGNVLRESFANSNITIAADTGAAKLYVSHYMIPFGRKWKAMLPGGSIDSMGFGLPAAIGAALGSNDAKEEKPLTIAIVGDGALLMNNELNALASGNIQSAFALFVLNDSSLSYVHQGFAAVMGRALDCTRFPKQVDFANMAKSFGLKTYVITEPGQINARFMQEIVARKEPVVVDCRIATDVIGPGYERYNGVRAALGRKPLSVPDMNGLLRKQFSTCSRNNSSQEIQLQSIIKEHVVRERFGAASGDNTLHLYGVIQRVFQGVVDPKGILASKETGGVLSNVNFGLGVSCFAEDTEDVGDGVFYNGRYFVRHTDAGMAANNGRLFKEGTVKNYRTAYSLGFTDLIDMTDQKILHDADCNGEITLRHMLQTMIGPPRKCKDDPSRMVGFVGLVDYKDHLGTSLQIAPTQGVNILPIIDEYARPSVPQTQSGICCGFVRTNVLDDDPEDVKELYRRMFFDNPRDGDGMPTETAEAGTYWISHTHGTILNGSMFESNEHLQNVAENTSLREQHLNDCFARPIRDIGHVIPSSSFERYLFVTFPIHRVAVFHPKLAYI